ncbi:hypothetical protein H310_04488 [Aphanomyces invadans]|uniref:Uncharacterized protein n=1 Tax=Aphanomyces invadans TaxID=157072 RepID=A0A024UCY6_9STRA|nr:hypothetical protein H310_04488 [Aphanomyces invadans]ETW04129.1 hypothetical protein H310_04488 [Aphanomyces invadans]RHY26409.1 hypothetical protein DYB32_007636 [Aphanomyces invadans]|eukprot:XP_008867085.1 hypothetical protein H310_04488 [Aphanomyces invadans]
MDATAIPPQAILLDKFNQVLAFRCITAFGTLGVADYLGEHGASTAATIASALKLHPSALFRLLRACANVGVVTQSSPHETESVFGLTPVGACLQSTDHVSLCNVLNAWAQPSHWQPLEHFEASIKTGQAATYAAYGSDIWTYYQQHPQEHTTFAASMSAMSEIISKAILATIAVDNASVIVDVGGSKGTLLSAVLTKAPHDVRGILFDLPHVVASPATLATYETGHRITATAGSFFESVPRGDIYLIKQILHDWDDAKCISILKTVVQNAVRGARVLVIELLLSSTVKPAAAIGELLTPSIFMDMNMLVMCNGQERTVEQYAALFAQAGLVFSKATPTPSHYVIIEGLVE